MANSVPEAQHSFETDIVGSLTEAEDDAFVLNGNDAEIKTVLILVGTLCCRCWTKGRCVIVYCVLVQPWKLRHCPWWNT